MRHVAAYDLVVTRQDGRMGPRLRATEPACADWIASGRRGSPPPTRDGLRCGGGVVDAGSIRNTAMTIERLATLLSGRVGRPVLDRTGITGPVDVDLRWTADGRGAAADDPLPSNVFTALDEQLGLRLRASTTDVSMLVIDDVKRPTPN
jgi:uncharacterized protein (TIGR03435 family)